MTDHKIGTREEWTTARNALLAREKEHTRLGDELARARRELPWVPVKTEYRFQTGSGEQTLAELFDGRSHARIATILTLMALGAACPGALARPVRRLTHSPGVVDYWPRFSPDGTTALFSHCEIGTGCGGAATSGYWTLWKTRIRHGTPAQFLVAGDTSTTRSNWLLTSPSAAEQIAFEGVDHRGDGSSSLWVLAADGSNLRRVPLADSVGSPSYPSWFPDGASVLITRGARTSRARGSRASRSTRGNRSSRSRRPT
jgi:hypothetical protein